MISGWQSIERLANNLESTAFATAGDLAFAMDHQQQRILGRTARFVDYEENPFKEYDEKRPYYYYPDGAGLSKSAHQARIAGIHAKTGGTRTKTGIRYESYAAFKRALGSLGVDLRGPEDPHMLDLMIVKVDGVSFKFGQFDYNLLPRPANTITLGIYETEKGQIAAAHNEGLGRMPQREFFAISSNDKDRIIADIEMRLKRRFERKFNGK